MQHLQQIVLPVLERHVAPATIRLQLLVAPLQQLQLGCTAQDIYQHHEAHLLFCAHHSRQCLLHQYGSVEALGRLLAHVTVAAVVIHAFSEVVEQYPPAAHLALGILLHALQLLVVDVFLAALFGELPEHDDVSHLVEENCLAGQTVTSSSSYLLIVALDALWQIVVHHIPHVALVYSHAKGNGSAHHIYLVIDKGFLHFIALRSRQSGMVGTCFDALLTQFLRHTLAGLPAHAVDDAALASVAADEPQHVVHLVLGRISSPYIQ